MAKVQYNGTTEIIKILITRKENNLDEVLAKIQEYYPDTRYSFKEYYENFAYFASGEDEEILVYDGEYVLLQDNLDSFLVLEEENVKENYEAVSK